MEKNIKTLIIEYENLHFEIESLGIKIKEKRDQVDSLMSNIDEESPKAYEKVLLLSHEIDSLTNKVIEKVNQLEELRKQEKRILNEDT